MNGGFWDLPAEERGYWYDKAEQDTGVSFHDLSPEERGSYYERAEGGSDGYSTYDDARQSERRLLAAVHQWARLNGWRRDRYGWTDGVRTGSTTLVTWSDGEVRVSHAIGHSALTRTPIWSCGTNVPVGSVVHAVDVLVALRVLPAFFSTAWGLAEDRYREQVETLAEEIARLRAAAGIDLDPEQWEAHAYKLGATYEWAAPAVGTFLGWLAYRHENEKQNNKILRTVIECRAAEAGKSR